MHDEAPRTLEAGEKMIYVSCKVVCDNCERERTMAVGYSRSMGSVKSDFHNVANLPGIWAQVVAAVDGKSFALHYCAACIDSKIYEKASAAVDDAIEARTKGQAIALVRSDFSGLAIEYKRGEIVLASDKNECGQYVVERPFDRERREKGKAAGSLFRTYGTIVGIPSSALRILT